jgi:pilus assembly protein CpaF
VHATSGERDVIQQILLLRKPGDVLSWWNSGPAGVNLSSKAIRTQITGAVNMIVQVSRMRDGIRRVTHVTEVIGMEGEVVTTQDLFTFDYEGENRDGTLKGNYVSSGVRPHFTRRAAYFGLDRTLQQSMMT